MSPHSRRDGSKAQYWRRWLLLWQRSGLSVSAFCQRYGLSQPNFYAWRRRLRQRDQAVAFVPVHVVPEPKSAAHAPSTGLELLLPADRVLRIGPAFDEATLRRLLPLLTEAPA